MPPTAAPFLVLFDIDGTLLRGAGKYHFEALVEAIRQVSGRQVGGISLPTQGMLDPDIVRILLERSGASSEEIERVLPAVIELAQDIFREICPDLYPALCPGLPAALDRLVAAGAVLGLVTGNLSRIAWRKMERAGLLPYFRFGAFSEEASDRGELVRLALSRARRSGWLDADTVAAMVGDHPNDVAAARYAGIRAIAVATGLTSREELERAGPDVLLEDLRGLTVDVLRGEPPELPGVEAWQDAL